MQALSPYPGLGETCLVGWEVGCRCLGNCPDYRQVDCGGIHISSELISGHQPSVLVWKSEFSGTQQLPLCLTEPRGPGALKGVEDGEVAKIIRKYKFWL